MSWILISLSGIPNATSQSLHVQAFLIAQFAGDSLCQRHHPGQCIALGINAVKNIDIDPGFKESALTDDFQRLIFYNQRINDHGQQDCRKDDKTNKKFSRSEKLVEGYVS